MERTSKVCVHRCVGLAVLAAAAASTPGLMGRAVAAQGSTTPAPAAGTTPAPAAAPAPWPKSDLNDNWKGTTLDPKWRVTLVGDAQANAGDSSVKLDSGLLHLTVNSSDTWVGGDDGIYLWQPANGDFQVTLEIHNEDFTSNAAKV